MTKQLQKLLFEELPRFERVIETFENDTIFLTRNNDPRLLVKPLFAVWRINRSGGISLWMPRGQGMRVSSMGYHSNQADAHDAVKSCIAQKYNERKLQTEEAPD